VVPAITDHEMPRILEAAAAAGASYAGYVMLRLPWGIKDLFADWLEQNFPDRREKVLARLRDLRGGKLYDAKFGDRMRGEGVFAEQIRALFETSRRRAGLDRPQPELSTAAFRRPGEQRSLW
jgi:DNA repair photolyase